MICTRPKQSLHCDDMSSGPHTACRFLQQL